MNHQAPTAVALKPETLAWVMAEGFNAENLNQPGRYQDSPLILASRQGRSDLVEEFIDAGVALNHLNMDGTNALWASVVSNSFDIARRLLAEGIELDNQNENGATVLMYAASAGKTEWVAFFLDKGARTDLESLDGYSALDLASNLGCFKLLRSRL